jgi:hypothetical protein
VQVVLSWFWRRGRIGGYTAPRACRHENADLGFSVAEEHGNLAGWEGGAAETEQAAAWKLSEDERHHREWMMEEVKDHFDQWQIRTVGLSGTSAGGFAVSLYVLHLNEYLEKWASDFGSDQLIIRSFLRPSKRL